jgi:hypothetical protein
MRIRPEMLAAQASAWAWLGQPGTWWRGEDRVAIVAETRHAAGCAFCRARKDAPVPMAVQGAHDTLGLLPAPAVEAIHRIRTDSGRLGEGWYRRLIGPELSEEQYVELVAVVAITVAVDSFRAGAGLPPLDLPLPVPGLPNRVRPAPVTDGLAWMLVLMPADWAPPVPDLYRTIPGPPERGRGNIHLALSLVPEAMIAWWDMFETMYLKSAEMRDFHREFRAVTHAQIEMLAARTAALNQCIY